MTWRDEIGTALHEAAERAVGSCPRCPLCDFPVIYRRWYLNRDGWWCSSCHDWSRPVAVP